MQVKSQQAPTVLLSVVVFLSSVSNQFVWSERNPCEITIVIIVLCFGNHLLKCIFKILENSLNDSKLDKQTSKCEPQEADSQKLWRSMIYIWVRTVYLNLTITVNGLLLISIFYYILPPSTSCLYLHQSRKNNYSFMKSVFICNLLVGQH